VDSVFIAIGNKLKIQWPRSLPMDDGLPFLLRTHVLAAHNTYRTIVHLAADDPLRENRRPEYVLSTAPLIRTLVDGLFTVVALLDDPATRVDQFFKGGWNEIRQQYERFRDAYAADPDWVAWLEDFAEYIEAGKETLGLTPEDQVNLKRLSWPTPGQLLRDKALSDPARHFLQYMNDWYYKELSADAHLSLPGLARRSLPLLEKTSDFDRERSTAVFTGLTAGMSILSEVHQSARWPDIGPRLEYIWTMLEQYWHDAAQVYRLRYKGRL